MRRKNGDIYLSIIDCYWLEVYVYIIEDYSVNIIDVYVYNMLVWWLIRVYLLCGCCIGMF